jgi:peptidyl-prolyl cis-trans isomerase A (cyclophilin A)
VLNEDNQPSGSGNVKLIQGGIFVSNHAREITIPGIPHETTQQTGITHKDGTISMARTTPGTASSEFFICIGNQPGFDYGGENNPDGQGMAAFGRVVKGMDIVQLIYSQPSSGTSITPTVRIKDIERE